jgi:hypothetical protein
MFSLSDVYFELIVKNQEAFWLLSKITVFRVSLTSITPCVRGPF